MAREHSDNTSNDAEALVAASLLGDERASELVEQRLKLYQEKYTQDAQKYKVERDKVNAGPIALKEDYEAIPVELRIGLDDLAAVHCTKYFPTFDGKLGKYRIKTLFDATKGARPRTTLHFTMNHAVEAHLYGSWADMQVVVVAPIKDMIAENGKPECMIVDDTYWNLNPGEDIILPDGTTILIPRATDDDQDHIKNGVQIKYYDAVDQAHIGELDSVPTKNRNEQYWQEYQAEFERIGQQRDDAANQLIKDLGYKTFYEMIESRMNPWLQIKKISLDDIGSDAHRHVGSYARLTTDVAWDFLNESTDPEFSNQTFSFTRNKYRAQLLRDWHSMPAQQRRTAWQVGLL